jgi:hypothetical protein
MDDPEEARRGLNSSPDIDFEAIVEHEGGERPANPSSTNIMACIVLVMGVGFVLCYFFVDMTAQDDKAYAVLASLLAVMLSVSCFALTFYLIWLLAKRRSTVERGGISMTPIRLAQNKPSEKK